MPLTRIRQTAIGNDSITSAKLAHDLDLDGDFVRVPHGTTAQRPSSPVAGYMRFNTDQGTLEQWNTTTNSWQAIDSPPIITSLAYSGSLTAADPVGGETITLTGTNFKSGATVTVGGTSASSVSVVNSTTITFTTPVKTAGDYDVIVINANGLQATLTNGISYNGVPSFTTAAGNVGSITEDVAMSTITIVAAEPDGGTLAYSITSGALPTGVSMSSSGAITGTPNVNPISDTTFNFTVTATDDESQTNSRAFNLIVLRPIYATQISNSLRFNTAYLTRTFSSGNQQIFTLSGWIKRSSLGIQRFFSCGSSGSSYVQYRFDTNDNILISSENGGAVMSLATTQKFRDLSAWYHLTLSVDTTQATASNRVKLYVNGEQVTDFSTSNYPTQNTSLLVNSSIAHYIGALSYGPSSGPLDGYMSDVYFVDGQQLVPTSFAEEFNGVWTPKTYTGTYGTNGFKLNFSDSSNLGDDTSGNANDFTANSLSAYDSVPDSPTTNFATFNYNNFPVMTFAEGGLKITTTTNNRTVWGSQSIPDTGKWYFEIEATNYVSGGGSWNGLGYNNHLGDNELDQSGIRIATYYGGIYLNNSVQSGGYGNTGGADQTADGDVHSFAIDMDNGLFYIAKNGTWYNSANPSSGTGGLDISANITAKGDKPYVPVVGRGGSQNETYTWNFGQDSTFAGGRSATSNADANGVGEFAYTVPTNFLSLCAKNLSESTINTRLDDRPEDYFVPVTYTGNGGSPGTQLVNIGFQPDFVWLKSRTQTYTHYLFNSLSGDNKHLISNVNNAEATINGTSDAFTFESTGFQVVATGGSALNESSQGADNMVGWCWKAGGAPTATNSAGVGNVPTSGSVLIDGVASTSALAGTIAADKISTNTKSGFSIVSYTGNATAGATVAHGLGVTPTMIILKSVSAAANWRVYHQGIGTSNTLFLNSTSGQTADGDRISGVSSTTFTLSSGNGAVNGSGITYIAYCFADVEGYSKMGTFVGQGDKTFVHTGFKPAFLMVKNYNTSTHHWSMYDNKRNTYNVMDKYIYANGNGTEIDADRVDFVSNGFVGRANSYDISQSGVGFVYMAFAEDPFKYAEAR